MVDLTKWHTNFLTIFLFHPMFSPVLSHHGSLGGLNVQKRKVWRTELILVISWIVSACMLQADFIYLCSEQIGSLDSSAQLVNSLGFLEAIVRSLNEASLS